MTAAEIKRLEKKKVRRGDGVSNEAFGLKCLLQVLRRLLKRPVRMAGERYTVGNRPSTDNT